MKTSLYLDIFHEDKTGVGVELNMVFDNWCTDQNKNNAILKVLVYFTELGYLNQINFTFPNCRR